MIGLDESFRPDRDPHLCKAQGGLWWPEHIITVCSALSAGIYLVLAGLPRAIKLRASRHASYLTSVKACKLYVVEGASKKTFHASYGRNSVRGNQRSIDVTSLTMPRSGEFW